jgi:hypothetical protein
MADMRQASGHYCYEPFACLNCPSSPLSPAVCVQVATEGDSFVIAFATVEEAVLFSAAVQEALVNHKVRQSHLHATTMFEFF